MLLPSCAMIRSLLAAPNPFTMRRFLSDPEEITSEHNDPNPPAGNDVENVQLTFENQKVTRTPCYFEALLLSQILRLTMFVSGFLLWLGSDLHHASYANRMLIFTRVVVCVAQ